MVLRAHDVKRGLWEPLRSGVSLSHKRCPRNQEVTTKKTVGNYPPFLLEYCSDSNREKQWSRSLLLRRRASPPRRTHHQTTLPSLQTPPLHQQFRHRRGSQ